MERKRRSPENVRQTYSYIEFVEYKCDYFLRKSSRERKQRLLFFINLFMRKNGEIDGMVCKGELEFSELRERLREKSILYIRFIRNKIGICINNLEIFKNSIIISSNYKKERWHVIKSFWDNKVDRKNMCMQI